tara:strand:- start:119 stop:229 length:111 start_codon:yes stop_codon:yes gene_type:complete
MYTIVDILGITLCRFDLANVIDKGRNLVKAKIGLNA